MVTTIAETITSSGRVRGVIATVVGAQAAGIIETPFMDQGDRVTAAQPLAMLKHDTVQPALTSILCPVQAAHALYA
jgi:multidrug efflux pump subunit AcrA (membrane-fusion protein)